MESESFKSDSNVQKNNNSKQTNKSKKQNKTKKREKRVHKLTDYFIFFMKTRTVYIVVPKCSPGHDFIC